MDIRPGIVLGGKYRLLRLLGRGAMGEVWAAQHESLQERVAVKLLAPTDDEDFETSTAAERTRARFRFEARIAAHLSRRTRHIVQVVDHGHEGALDYLAMELLEGETLEHLMRREERLRPDALVDIVMQIARALTVAHEEGVAHRDLKPANIFLTTDEEGHRVAKLLDFGIARVLRRHRVNASFETAQGIVVGTPGYMSPEQARGAMALDHQCDLWALATLAYEALVGSLPIDADNVTELLMKLCRGVLVPIGHRDPAFARLEPFFARAFDPSMDKRFASAVALAAAFEAALGPSPATISTSNMPVAETIATPPRTPHPAWRPATLGVLGLGAALIAGELLWLASGAVVRPPSLVSSTMALTPPPTTVPPPPLPPEAPSSIERLIPSPDPTSAPSARPPTSVLTYAVPVVDPPPAPSGSSSATATSPVPPSVTTEVMMATPPPAPSTRDRSEVF